MGSGELVLRPVSVSVPEMRTGSGVGADSDADADWFVLRQYISRRDRFFDRRSGEVRETEHSDTVSRSQI
jgi:hypothetical protein